MEIICVRNKLIAILIEINFQTVDENTFLDSMFKSFYTYFSYASWIAKWNDSSHCMNYKVDAFLLVDSSSFVFPARLDFSRTLD